MGNYVAAYELLVRFVEDETRQPMPAQRLLAHLDGFEPVQYARTKAIDFGGSIIAENLAVAFAPCEATAERVARRG